MSKKVGFTAWLKEQHHRDDPVGNLSRDMREDKDWPGRARHRGLRSHLESRGAIGKGLQALDDAYTEWGTLPPIV
jgi:hypothetical protein